MTVRFRSTLRRIHLWLGLSFGLLFALLGLTGSALVFYIEIDGVLNRASEAPESVTPTSDWTSPKWDRALATGRARWNDPAGTWSFEATGEGGEIPARYYPPAHGHGHHHAEREMVWFAPDGSRVVRSDPWGDYAMSWIYELHANLLSAEPGRQVSGWSGFVLLILLVTGIIAWWPRGSWRKALALKRGAAPMRRLYDLHKLFGVWSMILLFLLVGTGVFLALADTKTQILTAVVGAPDKQPDPKSSAASGKQISVSAALASAQRALPGATLAFIDVPAAGPDPFRMRVQVPGDPHRRFPGSFIWVDQYSGKVLAVHDVRGGNEATTIAKWIRALHDGSAAALPGRILAALLGLVPAILFITGFLHWRRRAAARAKYRSTGSIS